MTAQLIAAVCLLFGSQQLCIGHLLLGGLSLLLGLCRGRHLNVVFLVGVTALGLCSGLRERALTRHPPVPRGEIRVQPASWRVQDNFATFEGKSVNGVAVRGQVTLTRQQAEQVTSLRVPVYVAWTKLRRINQARNLGEFDFRTYAWEQRHQAYTVVTGTFHYVRGRPRHLVDWLHQLRLGLMMRLNQLPQTTAFYARALLVGVIAPDAVQAREDFSRLGVIHLFSVSGLHVFALVGVLYQITRRLRVTAETVDGLLLVLLPLLLVIIPMSAGLLRAVWMRWLALMAQKVGLAISTFDVLIIVLMGNLLWYPQVLAGLGGQMTYLLTLVLVVLPETGAFRQCLRMAAVSAGPVIYHVYGIHLLTFVFNYLLMPIFEVVLMPVLFVLTCWPHVPGVLLVERGLEHLNGVLSWLAQLPGYLLVGRLPALALAAFTGALLWRLAGRHVAPVVIAIVALAVCYVWRPQPQVTHFALNQGEAVLIEPAWHGAPILVGAGGTTLRADSAQARNVIAAYLQYRGLSRLNALVLPDATAASAGDVGAVVKQIPARVVYYPAAAEKQQNVRRVKKVARIALPVGMPQMVHEGKLAVQVLPASVKKPVDLRVYAKIGKTGWWLSGRQPQRDDQLIAANQYQVTHLRLGARGGDSSVTSRLLQQRGIQAVVASPDGKGIGPGVSTATQLTCSAANVPLYRTDRQEMLWFTPSRREAQMMHSK